MVENRRWLDILSHAVLIAGVAVVAFPVYLTFVASSLTAEQVMETPMSLLPGSHLVANYSAVLSSGMAGGAPLKVLLFNSLVSALVIAVAKIAISITSAYAIVYFRFPGRMACFWLIFVTLMLPVEVRILPTFKVVSDLGMLDSYAGLTVPLVASATATFLFRQFFLTIPDELAEAARIDGAGPMRFFIDVVVPLSRTNMAALFVILFIYGWNQYLWPLIITTREDMYTAVIGIRRMITGGDAGGTAWDQLMPTALLVMLPPALVVILMQKWFVKGLVDGDK